LAVISLSKFPIKNVFTFFIKSKQRTSLRFNSTACAHKPQAASSRDSKLHHSTKPVASEHIQRPVPIESPYAISNYM